MFELRIFLKNDAEPFCIQFLYWAPAAAAQSAVLKTVSDNIVSAQVVRIESAK